MVAYFFLYILKTTKVLFFTEKCFSASVPNAYLISAIKHKKEKKENVQNSHFVLNFNHDLKQKIFNFENHRKITMNSFFKK